MAQTSGPKCMLCGGSNTRVKIDMSGLVYQSGPGIPGSIHQCETCGMLFKEYRGNPDAFYDRVYGEAVLRCRDYNEGLKTKQFFSEIVTDLLNRVSVGRESSQSLRLLDVGSSTGTVLELANNLGLTSTGVELSEKLVDASRSRGLSVIPGDISHVLLQKTFDVVTMFDILEHLPQPVRALSLIRKQMREGGLIALYLPDTSSLIFSVAKFLCRLGFKAPVSVLYGSSHLGFYTPETLDILLKQCGFQRISVTGIPYGARPSPETPAKMIDVCLKCVESIGRIVNSQAFHMLIIAQTV